MYKTAASLNKIILWEKIPTIEKPGTPMCPPNYTKNRKVRDLLDIPDPKGKMLSIQIQSLRPLRARVQLISTEKSERTVGKK